MKNPLSQVSGKEESVRTIASQGSKKTKLRDTDILRFVYYGKIEWRIILIDKFFRQRCEDLGLRNQSLLL